MLWSPSVVNSVGGCSRTRAVKAWFTLSNEKRRTGVVEIVPIFRPSFGPMAQAKERRDRGATDTTQAKITEYGKRFPGRTFTQHTGLTLPYCCLTLLSVVGWF